MSQEFESVRTTGRRLAGVAFAAVLMISALAVTPAPTAAQSNGTNTTFIVEQGSQCIQITPLGDGTKTVEQFYDYEVLNQTANYSSLGTVDIQKDQTSQIFVYRGSEGLSLVFLHDKIHTPGGFVATANISGLPSDGEWVVEDDNYTHRDDTFKYTDTGAYIEWNSNGERTDGGVFRGLGSSNYSTITIDIKFNEQVDRYPFEEWAGSPEENEIEHWIVRSGTGETTELDLDEPVQLSPGTCDGGVSTFTPSTSTATATSGTSIPTASDTATQTTAATATATQTATTTATATQTATATATQTATATATTNESTAAETTASGGEATTQATTAGGSTADGGENATEAGNGSAKNASNGDGSGSGAFGPGFGVGIGLVAVLLAVGTLARRKR